MADQLGRAFNPSVLFMMAMPFAVFGAIAGGLVYAYRRAQKQIARHDNNTSDTSSPEK